MPRGVAEKEKEKNEQEERKTVGNDGGKGGTLLFPSFVVRCPLTSMMIALISPRKKLARGELTGSKDVGLLSGAMEGVQRVITFPLFERNLESLYPSPTMLRYRSLSRQSPKLPANLTKTLLLAANDWLAEPEF